MSILDSIRSPEQLRFLTDSQLSELTDELRSFLLESVSQTGGHLSSNLGVTELTVALHCVFDSPCDKIIFDVGHQAYVHKLLTGRKDQFGTLRQLDGLSGFLKKCESEHDIFEAGHSSTSISAGLGIAMARDLAGEDHHVISVIGDGAMTGGMAFEALNHAGHTKTRLIVVLNDNEMSIDENVGGLSRYLSRLRTAPSYSRAKDEVETFLNRIPGVGRPFARSIQKAKDSLKYFLVAGVLFEELGFTYLGPIDGHDISAMRHVFSLAKKVQGPVLVHVLTKKGLGYTPAEEKPDDFHGVGPFDLNTGAPRSAAKNPTFSDVFGDALCELAAEDERVVGITAAMPSGTGMGRFKAEFPTRYIDVGIAEQHAVTLAAGLATAGQRPVFAVYSTFLQRAYDQMVHDVCMQKLPVIFAIDRAGLVGQDGETHHGVFDLSYLMHMPNMTILAPKDGLELKAMMRHALALNGPVAIRYPRGTAYTESSANPEGLISCPMCHVSEGEAVLFAVGTMYHTAQAAIRLLHDKGVRCSLIHPRVLKPFQGEQLSEVLGRFRHYFVLEDNVRIGGYGMEVLHALQTCGREKPYTFTSLSFPDCFIEHGAIPELFRRYHLDAEAVYARILEVTGVEG